MVAAGPRGRLAPHRPIRGCGRWASAGGNSSRDSCTGKWPASGSSSSRRANSEEASVFSDEEVLQRRIRKHLPPELKDIVFRIDIPRHVYRPEALAPTADQNFLLDPATGKIHRLNERELVPADRPELPHLPHLRGRQSAQCGVRPRDGPDRGADGRG